MITLYGAPLSPWYNKVKLALIEKGVNFDEARCRPSPDDPALLAASPMGNIPYVDINGFKLAESNAIIEWLEDAYPTLSLLPPTTNGRGRARELAQLVDHYLIAASAPLAGEVLWGRPLGDGARQALASGLLRGVAAVGRRADPRGPWLCGEDFTLADVALAVAMPHLATLCAGLPQGDPLTAWPGYPAYRQRLLQRHSVIRVWDDRARMLAAWPRAQGS